MVCPVRNAEHIWNSVFTEDDKHVMTYSKECLFCHIKKSLDYNPIIHERFIDEPEVKEEDRSWNFDP